MNISIEPLMEQPNQVVAVHLLMNQDVLDDPSLKAMLDGAIRLEGSLENMGNGVVNFDGKLQTKFSVPCDRCTQSAEVLLCIELYEQFRKEWIQDDPSFEQETYTYIQNEIDVSPMINDNILLHWPAKVLCSEHCKGLCPVCGRNRNTTHCSCHERKMDENPFAKLQALLCDDEEV